MSAEHNPLVSDERIATIAEYVSGTNIDPGIRHERKQAAESALYLFRDHIATYESDCAKTREVVQKLVDALEATKHKPFWWKHHPSEEWIYDALADAKSELNIEPTKP